MAVIKYKDKETGEWRVLTESFNLSVDANNVYVGDEEPVDPKCKVWYDTSYLPTPVAKCKLDNGEWVIVAGGGGGVGGGSTNNADFDANNVTGWLANTIAYGDECNVYVTWYSIEDNIPTGKGVVQISVNDVLKTSYEIDQSEIVLNEETGEEERKPIPIPLTQYLIAGTNNVSIRISDVYGNPRVLKFTITAVNLSITSSFGEGANPESKKPHKGDIDFRYTLMGDVEYKTVYFKLDGEILDTRVITEINKQKQFIIPAQTHGSHTFEVYCECKINGKDVPSNKLFYDIIWYEEDNAEPIIACNFNIESAKQFATLNIPWLAYNNQSSSTTVTITDNFGWSVTRTADQTEQQLSYKAKEAQPTTITFSVDGIPKKVISFEVIENKIDVNAQTDFLELYLDAKDRSNDDEERDPLDWSYGDIKAQLNQFNKKSDCWQLDNNGDTVLRVSGDAYVFIPYKIFEYDCKSSGKTIEFEFATRDVLNPNSPIIECWNNEKGIKITAQEALFKSAQSTLSRQYKENEHIRVSFVIQNDSNDGNRLIFLYIDGVQSACVQYTGGDAGDNFAQASPAGIRIGSKYCTTDIYCIRVYNTYLTNEAILDNWIADTQNIELKIERYNRNNIFNSLGRVDYKKIHALNVPYLVVDAEQYSDLPDKEDQEVIVSGEYVDPLYPKRNFAFINATITPQGTSSLKYARKNYKLKLEQNEDYMDKPFSMTVNGSNKDKYALRDTSMPTNVFTFKADVASSEGANNVELAMLYDEVTPAKTPPQKVEGSKVRQGIEGYPCLMFYRNGSEYYFIGKYNFNNDKGTAEVFGLQKDKEKGTWDESWEIRLNNDPMAVWKDSNFNPNDTYYDEEEGKDMPRWYKAFEPRFPKKNMDVTNLSAFSSWLKSTDTQQATNSPFSELPEFQEKGITEVTFPIKIYLNKGGFYEFKEEESTYRKDTPEYRLTKFRYEFSDKANVDAMVFNYVFTETFLMVDNRAKNAFPTRFDEDGKWLILPYDYDTAIGINNSGELKFGYWLEDIDNVFNGEGGSVLYVNMRLAFSQEIKAMYQKIRDKNWRKGAFSYEAIEKRFADHQKVWGEAIFNEDARFKYIDPLINDGTNDLPKLQGSKASQRQWWLYNRFRYLDSKYNIGDALNDFIFFYAYVKDDLEVTPYADIYATAQFDSTISSTRALRGDGETPATYTVHNPFKGETVEEGTDHIITIYSASQLASIGDLSKFKIGGNANFKNGVKLNSLIVGNSADPHYENPNLAHLSIGDLKLLKKFDMGGCINFVEPVDLSGCSNIEEVYALRTQTTAILLPNGGILKTLHLPSSITSLVIQNQPLLKNFSIGSYANIETLILEGVDFKNTFDIVSILDTMIEHQATSGKKASVKLSGFELDIETADEIFALYDKFDEFKGVGNNVAKPQIEKATIHCGKITSNDYAEMKRRYKDITIDFAEMESTVRFYKEAKQGGEIQLLTERTVKVGENGVITGSICIDPINDGTENAITTPTKESIRESKFVYVGWDNDLQNIIKDTDVNAVFEEYMMYFVTFKDKEGNIVKVNDKNGVPQDTNIYYDIAGENRISFPAEFVQGQTYYDETINGITTKWFFSHWQIEGTNTKLPLTVSGNVYKLICQPVYSDHRVYVVKFLDYNGNEVDIQNGITDTEITSPVAPDWQSENGQYDHRFKGWSTKGTNNDEQNIEQVISNIGETDIIYYAVYNSEIRSYEVTFYGIVGGTEGKKQKVIYRNTLNWGTEMPVPTDDDRAVIGYYFTKWDIEPEAKVTGNRVYTAQYEIESYDITFKYWNGKEYKIETQKVKFNTMPIIPTETEREADAEYTYKFTGWSPTPIPAKDTTGQEVIYEAQYNLTKNKYRISFYAQNKLYYEDDFEYGTIPNIINPQKDNYDFKHWIPELKAVEGETTYTAYFEPTVYTVISRPSDPSDSATDSDVNTYQSVTTNYSTKTTKFRKYNFNIPLNAVLQEVSVYVKCSSETANGKVSITPRVIYNKDTGLYYIRLGEEVSLFDYGIVTPRYYKISIDLEKAQTKLSESSELSGISLIELLNLSYIITANDSKYFDAEAKVYSSGSLFDQKKAEIRYFDVYVEVKYTIPDAVSIDYET